MARVVMARAVVARAVVARAEVRRRIGARVRAQIVLKIPIHAAHDGKPHKP